MDVYFESGGLSLDEMLAGDIKTELDESETCGGSSGSHHHHQGTESSSSSSSSAGAVLRHLCWERESDDGPPSGPTLEWSTASLHSALNLDISGDPATSVMVNPSSVMPIRIKDPLALQQVKQEIKEEVSLEEEEEDEDEEEEEEEYEEDIEEEEEEQEVTIEHEEEEDAEEEEEEEEEEDEEEEEEEVVVEQGKVQIKQETQHDKGSLWTTLVTKPVKVKPHELNSKPRYVHYEIKQVSPSPQHSVRQPQNKISHQNGNLSTVGKVTSIKREGGGRSVLMQKYVEEYPKPAYSYSCLIAMALKNSTTGSLPVSEIYNFMCEHFPYFKSAPAGWKNSVRHNLSLNKCFEKIEKVSGGGGGGQRKGCLWAMNPSKITKMDDEVAKWSRKDPEAIKRAMRFPETLDKLERGDMKIGVRSSTHGSGGVILHHQSNGTSPSSNGGLPTPGEKRRRSTEVKQEVEEDEDGEDEEEEEEEEEEVEAEVTEEEEEATEDEGMVEEATEEDEVSEDEGEVPPSLKPFDARLNTSLLLTENFTSDLGVEFSDEMYEELGLLQQVLSGGGSGEGEDLDLFGCSSPASAAASVSAVLSSASPVKRPRLTPTVVVPSSPKLHGVPSIHRQPISSHH